ncbi:hypothetical protein APY03_0682 [Variovorax sp. WDL1]|nr:hypothetical protein APY03_0682 [Variovorax sp. WDL1]
MQEHPKGITFSTKRPNVIVGPNGAGKSALLKTLALQTLSYQTGESAFDDNYTRGLDSDDYWHQAGYRWSRDFRYLNGLEVATDGAPALYYQPGHIPGHDNSIAASMMCGYFDEARAYGTLIKDKSSGQRSQALLEKLKALLSGDKPTLSYQYVNWHGGTQPLAVDRLRDASDCTLRAEVLKKRYGNVAAGAVPVVLMDEPEQSLDAKAEALLWRQIADADMSRLQVIVATHSLYPMMHPEHFHLIEAVPGYVAEVQSLLS